MSIDIKMAWRNIWRNPRRSILTISAITFACILLVFMLSFQFGSYEAMIKSAIMIHTGDLQVQASGYHNDANIRRVVTKPEAVGALLDKIPEVETYTFRGNAFSLVSSAERTYGVVVIGIDPAREAVVSTLKSSIRKGSYFAENDDNQALIGDLLAHNLQVGPGDELTVLGQGRDGSIAATVVKVKGIYSSGQDNFDRSFIHIPLKTFNDVYDMRGAVHEVVVIGKTLKTVPLINKAVLTGLNNIKNKYPLVALDWKELMPGLIQGIKIDLVSGLIFYFILVIVVAFSILNTFLMAIFERTREFGVLMAIGTTPLRLTRLIMLESATMILVGITIGVIAGCLVTWYFQVNGILMASSSEMMSQFGLPDRLYPQLSLLSVFAGPAVVFVITFITALIPALKIRRLKPVEALTYV